MSGFSLPALVGTYTPTLTGVANVAASTAAVCQYIRLGKYVMVFGTMLIDPTLAAPTTTTIGISLPIASNLAAVTDLNGVGACHAATTAPNSAGPIYADAVNDRAEMSFSAGNLGNIYWGFSFMYEIK